MAPAILHAVLERLTLRIQARERGQERRVNVQNAIRKRVEQRRADQPHVAGQADEIDTRRGERRRDRAIEVVAAGEFLRIDVARLDPGRRARISPAASGRFEMTTAIARVEAPVARSRR